MDDPYAGYNRVPRPMRPGSAERRLRILFLYSRPPLPMTRGDELTVSHLLEFLHARGHAVDLVTLCDPKAPPLRPEHRAWLESRCRSVAFVPHGRLEGLVGALGGALKGLPAQIGYLRSQKQEKRVQGLLEAESYDLAYAYYIRSAEALRPAMANGRAKATFLALQLSQTLNTARLAASARTLAERLFYRFESRRMGAYEAKVWQGVSRVVLIGKKDVAAIADACGRHGQPPIGNVVMGPHGVDTEQFKPGDPALVERKSVVMSGVMRYAPNVEAALWFAREVWPRVRAVHPDARFTVVGRDPVPALLALDGKDGIHVTGTVDDPAAWIGRAEVAVAPIRAAAGLQNKLLEAMAMARPVVATPVANEGIGAEPGRDLLVVDRAEDMAAAVVRLFGDAAERERLGANARAFIERHWTWEGPFLHLERAFVEAVEEGEARGARAA